MASLRRCFRESASASDSPRFSEIHGSGLFGAQHPSRREFIKGALALGAAAMIPGCRRSGNESGPRVAIVGAGIAGLSAAHALAKGGLSADLYEAGARAGGRILTLQNVVAPGLLSEAGGEFIDSDHADMLALAREFGFAIKDAQAPEFSGRTETAWFFGGRLRAEAEVALAVREMTGRIQMDIGALPDRIVAGAGGKAAQLDTHSLDEYLAKREVTGWLRDLLVAAYVTEFGLDAGQQSCLNLLTLISLDTSAGRFQVFGKSDERYRVDGGNQAVTDALADKYQSHLKLNHRLEAIASAGEGFKLSFQGPGGPVETRADVVILTLPFTLLRSVDMRVELPPLKRKAIDELGYGTNAKLFLGFSSRPWRKAGFSGNFFTDGPMQSGWDHTRVQPEPAGGLTVFQGGSAGVALGQGGPAAQAAAMSDPLEALFPGSKAARNGKVGAFHWPSYPLSLGSYACYKPGQWTGFAGEEGKAEGNLFFAGEHCSLDFQGYMNGGAATGREAAQAVLAKWRSGKTA